MPELAHIPEPPKSAKDTHTEFTGVDDEDLGPKPKRWKLRLRKKPEADEKDGKKKGKKGKKRKQETPPPEAEVEEWELGPTMEEMRQGVLDKYYEDVRARAKILLEYRNQSGVRRIVVPPTAEYLQNLLNRDFDEISSVTTVLTEADIAKLPTILEGSKENLEGELTKNGATLHSILAQLASQGAVDHSRKSISATHTPIEVPPSPEKQASAGLASTESPQYPVKPSSGVQEILRSMDSPVKPKADPAPVSASKTIRTLSSSSEFVSPKHQAIPQDDGGESLNENEPLQRPRPYDNNEFGRRIRMENVLHYVQNKLSGFMQPKPKEEHDVFYEDEEMEDENLEMGEELEGEVEETELETDELRAMFECVWEGDIDLLDDLLDLPGADINLKWFGENLLMTAIRAGKRDVAAYLIDNDIDTKAEVARFERRDDVKIEIEMQRAIEQTQEKMNKKRGKKKGKEKEKMTTLEVSSNDMSTSRDVSTVRDEAVKTPDKLNSKLADMECYMVDCREMAQEFGTFDIVDMIDAANGQMWDEVAMEEKEVRLRKPLDDKLREQGLYIESDDEHFMVEPDKPKPPTPDEIQVDEKKQRKKRQSSGDIHKKYSITEHYPSHQPTPHHGETPQPHDMPPVPEPDITLVGTPVPQTPPPIINIELPRSKTKQPYRGSRAFLTRKAFNTKGKEIHRDAEVPELLEPRKLVEVHGSFATERKAWTPQKSNFKANNPLVSRSLGDFESIVLGGGHKPEVEKYSRLRQVKPWQEDNPEYFNNLLKRQSSFVKIPSMREQMRSRITRENTVLPIVGSSFGRKTLTSPMLGAKRHPSPNLARSLELSPLKSRIAQSDEERRQLRKSANPRERLTKSSDISNRFRPPGVLGETKLQSTPLQPLRPPQRLCQRGLTMDMSANHKPKKRPQSKSQNPKDNDFTQRVITMQKYYGNTPAKRLSPAGLLKASHGLTTNQVSDSIRTSLEKITGAPHVKKFTRFAGVTVGQA